ncbi:hypothetical protein ES702_00138 [subsurface metagenome]
MLTLSRDHSLHRVWRAITSAKIWTLLSLHAWCAEPPTSSNPHRGWHKAVIAFAFLTALTLTLNIVCAVVAHNRGDTEGVLYTGDCQVVARWNTALHLLINVLGTALLAASSFTMQCLSSPTRAEADEAHRKEISLHVGLSSWSNLIHMPWWKGVLWGLLCLSTLPLHLFWNSTVFSTIGANRFNYMIVTESFLSGAEFISPTLGTSIDLGNSSDFFSDEALSNFYDPMWYLKRHQAHAYKRLEPSECLVAYSQTYVTKYRNFLAISTPRNGTRMSPGGTFPTTLVSLSEFYGNMSNRFAAANKTGVYISPYPFSPFTIETDRAWYGYPPPLWNGSSVLAFQLSLTSMDIRPVWSIWPCYGWLEDRDWLEKGECDPASALKKFNTNGTWYLRPFNNPGMTYPSVSPSYPIDYCFAETVGAESCQLSYVPYILTMVIFANILKLFAMVVTAVCLRDIKEPIFATIGDAISSYLQRPDQNTQGLCLMDHEYCFDTWSSSKPFSSQDAISLREDALVHYNRPHTSRLYQATTRRRLTWTLSLCISYLLLGIGLLVVAVLSFRPQRGTVWSAFGFGKVSNENRLKNKYNGGDTAQDRLENSILLVNSFQLVLSIAYFVFNSYWTAQCSAMEWVSFLKQRKPLRVTWPRGQQRSTYYLNLPWRYGISITLCSILLHFLVSQSIFLAQVKTFHPDGTLSDRETISDCGVSPVALLTTLCVATTLIAITILHGYRKIDARMPLHGNSSAVISAMCHPTSDEAKDAHFAEKPLMWGVVQLSAVNMSRTQSQGGRQYDIGKDGVGPGIRYEDTIGHCAFTTRVVEAPVVGKNYR